MKKLLLSFLAFVVFTGLVKAETINLVAESMDKTGTTDNNGNLAIESATAENFTFAFDKTTAGTTAPNYNTKAKDIRLYANNTMTIATKDGSNMTEITFTISAQGKKRLTDMTVNQGNAVSNGADTWTVVWTGNANEVTFTVGEKTTIGTEPTSNSKQTAGQFDFTDLQIVVNGEKTTSSAPVFTPAAGNFAGEQVVTISAADGAKIYYTTDNTEPTTASDLYSTPIVLTTTTTVKAIAVEDGLNPSSVVSATYTAIQAESVSTLAELIEKGLTDETSTFCYTGNATVTYQNGSNLYIQDATAGLLVYGSGLPAYKNGDKLTGFSGTFKNYFSTYELMADATSFAAATANEPIEATVTDVEDITGDIQNTYVRLNQVSIDVDATTLTDGKDASVAYYNKFQIELPADLSEAYDVIGVVSYYTPKGADEPVVQIYPIEFVGATPSSNEVATLSEFIENGLADGTLVMTYTGKAAVTYVNGKNMYIQDETAGILVYGDLGREYAKGDQLSGFKGTFDNYFYTYELIPVADSFTDPVGTVDIKPAEIAPEAVTAEMQNQYVMVSNVTIDADNTLLVADSGSVKFYNKFKLDIPSDGKTYNVEAVINYYQAKDAPAPEVQVYPIAFIDASSVDSVVSGNVINAEYYNLQGVRLTEAPVKGLYIVRNTMSDGQVVINKIAK